jgi:hypothetical protein
MKLPTLPTLAPRVIMVIAAIVLIAVLAFAVPSCLQKRRAAADQNRVDHAQAGAAQASAKDAGQTQSTVNANEVASEALGRSNEKDIRDAQGSDAVVAAPANTAGIRALCLRRAYRDTERCRLLNAR